MRNEEILLSALKARGYPQRIALDGRCASGKTTLAETMQRLTNCVVIHMDDFYLPFDQRMALRMEKPGGHMDVERLREEILLPLKRGEGALYRPYDCHEGKFCPSVEIEPGRMVLIEGSYSMHPYLRELYDWRLFLDIRPEDQLIRLKKRNPNALEAFRNTWIPREEKYFSTYEIRKHCDLILNAEV